MLSWMLKPAEPERPVIDLGYLDRLGRNIGVPETRELLADGLMELTERLAKARDCADSGQASALGDILHNVAGVAGHLGLSALSARAADAQRAMRDRGAAPEAALAPVLGIEQASLDALRDYCRNSEEDT